MTVGIGDKLGVHEILSLLGKGGMGEPSHETADHRGAELGDELTRGAPRRR
jgi:hypothetical protein